ncbi:DUF805 domain-containing protein [uncultured Flavobacterium sp.]|uniref:DUF805 domain-containing protein n=1 Tax=uncultured Flavobacterium sp. TaxID=165435 RepID=UPI0025D9DAAA|nr:DUF805 domain-containing protein [uncultured Flavobacterium sp.]
MIEWYLKVVRDNYANFSGRARRSEYWYFRLCNFLIVLALMLISLLLGQLQIGLVLYILYAIAILVPSLALTVRRLHDTGKSGWFYFVSLIPLIGPIWILVLFCTEGDNGTNEYGEDPKTDYNEFDEIGNASQV